MRLSRPAVETCGVAGFTVLIEVTNGLVRSASEDTQFGQAKNVLPAKVGGPDAQVWLNVD